MYRGGKVGQPQRQREEESVWQVQAVRSTSVYGRSRGMGYIHLLNSTQLSCEHECIYTCERLVIAATMLERQNVRNVRCSVS